jgi:hypothetical protein
MDTRGRVRGVFWAVAFGLLGCGPTNQTEVPNQVPYVVLALVHTPSGVDLYHDTNASLDCLSWRCRPNPESCGYRPPEPEPPPICLDFGFYPTPDAGPADARLPADAESPDAASPDARADAAPAVDALHDAAPAVDALHDAAPADAAPVADAAPAVDAGPPAHASMALTECISAEEALYWPYDPYNPYSDYNSAYDPWNEPNCYDDAPSELCECVGGRIVLGDGGVELVLDARTPIEASSFAGQHPVGGWIDVTNSWTVELSRTQYITHYSGVFELDLPDGVEVRSGLFYPVREK